MNLNIDQIKDGGTAFPTHPELINDVVYQSNGLTKREVYALAALTGIIHVLRAEPWNPAVISVRAFSLADHMLKQSEIKP